MQRTLFTSLCRSCLETVHSGDGAAHDPGECDAMLINAGVTHPLPLWLDRLRDGGRLVVPITLSTTQTLGSGVMIKITRKQGGFPCRVISPVAIYSCTSLRTPGMEPLLRKAFTTQTILKLRSLRRDVHEPAETCLVHGPTLCLSSADA